MSKRNRVSIVPKTPRGQHICFANVSADEIDFDDEISVKSTVYRGRKKTSIDKLQAKAAVRSSSKFLIRKSTDWKKIKNIDDRIEALISNPMIEVRRRRPLGESKSFTTTDLVGQTHTPLYVPSSMDPEAVASRRMSTYVLSKFTRHNQSMPSLDQKRASVCTDLVHRLKLSPVNPNTPICSTSISGLHPPHAALRLLQTEANLTSVEPMEVDENSFEYTENQPPRPLDEQQPEEELTKATEHAFTIEGGSPKEPASVSQFRVLLGMEMARLSATKSAWEDVIEEEGNSIPETALDSIRVATGKCGLLLTKKFPFFRQLIDMAETSLKVHADAETDPSMSSNSLQQSAGLNDLLGYWATIAAEITQINGAFERLRNWRETSHWTVDLRPETPARFGLPLAASKFSRGRKVNANTPTLKPSTQLKEANPKPLERLIGSKNKPVSKLRPSKTVPSKFAQFLAKKRKKQIDIVEPTVELATKSPKGDLTLRRKSITPKLLGSSKNTPMNCKSSKSVSRIGLTSSGRKSLTDSPVPRKYATPDSEFTSPFSKRNSSPSPSATKSFDFPTNSTSDVEILSALGLTATSGPEYMPLPIGCPSGKPSKQSCPATQPCTSSLYSSPVAVNTTPRGRPRKSITQETPLEHTPDLLHHAKNAKRSRGRPPKSPAQIMSSGLFSPVVIPKISRDHTPKPTFGSVTKRALLASSSIIPPKRSRKLYPIEIAVSPQRQSTKTTERRSQSAELAATKSLIPVIESPRQASKTHRVRRSTPFVRDALNNRQSTDELSSHPLPTSGRRRPSYKSILIDSSIDEHIMQTSQGSSERRGRTPKSSFKKTPGRKSGLAHNLPRFVEDSSENAVNQDSLVGKATPLKEVIDLKSTARKKTPRGCPSKTVSILDALHETPSMTVSIAEDKWAVPDLLPPTHKRSRIKNDSVSLLESSTTKSMRHVSQPSFSARTPLSVLRRLSPPPRPITGTPRPNFPHNTSNPATTGLALGLSLLTKKLGGNTITPPPSAAKRGCKSVRFPTNGDALSSTPHGHFGGSGSPQQSLPVTPHTSFTTDPHRRVSRGRRGVQIPTLVDTPSQSTSDGIP